MATEPGATECFTRSIPKALLGKSRQEDRGNQGNDDQYYARIQACRRQIAKC